MNSLKNDDFDIKDIIAMIIAAFQLLLPPLLTIFGMITIIYFILRLLTRV